MYSKESQRKRLLKGNLAFLICAFPVFAIQKGSLVLWFQTIQDETLNSIMFMTTKFGEAYVLIPFLVLLILLLKIESKEKKQLILTIAIMAISLLVITQGLKRFVFDFPRPAAYFSDLKIKLNPIEGMKFKKKFSFPSGHTASAFFGYFLFFYLLPQFRKFRYVWFIPAILVGISRVYLGQHFLHDIWFGAWIGWMLAELTLFWIGRNSKYLNQVA